MLITPRSRPPSLSPFLLLPASRRDEKPRPPFGLVRPSVYPARSPAARGRNILLPRRSVDSTAARALGTSLSLPDCLPLLSYLSSRCTPCMQTDRTRAREASIFRLAAHVCAIGHKNKQGFEPLNLMHDLEVICIGNVPLLLLIIACVLPGTTRHSIRFNFILPNFAPHL